MYSILPSGTSFCRGGAAFITFDLQVIKNILHCGSKLKNYKMVSYNVHIALISGNMDP